MTLPQTPAQQNIRPEAQSTRGITIVGIIVSLICAAGFLIASAQTGLWQYTLLGIAGVLASVSFLIAYFINDVGRTRLAGWLTLITLAVLYGAFSLQIKEFDFIFAGIMLLFSINIALQVFQRNESILAISISIAFTLAITGTVLINSSLSRINLPIWAQELIVIAAGLTGMVLSINTLRKFEFASLRGQLIVAFLIISIIPVLVVQIPQLINIQETLRTSAGQDLYENTINAASQIERTLVAIQTATTTAAKLPVFTDILSGDLASAEIAKQSLTALKLQNNFIESYAILDITGKDIVDTNDKFIGKNEGQEAYFLSNLIKRRPVVSDVYYDNGTEKLYLFIGAPIFDANSDIIGVLRARIDGEILQNEIEQLASRLGKDHVVALMEQHQIFLGHSTTPELIMRSATPLSESILNTLQGNRLVPTGSADTLSAGLTALGQNTQNPDKIAVFEGTLSPYTPTPLIIAGQKMSIKPWVVVIGKSTEAISAPITQQVNNIIIILTVAALAIFAGASITASLITEPMGALVGIANKIGAGDLEIRTNSTRKDELGSLARAFDGAAGQLEKILASMESRVAERTEELAKITQNSEVRANQLQAIAQVARAVSSLQDLDELLPLITDRISRSFGYYHVGIFLIDQSGSFAVLQASNSEGGKRMLERRHRLRVGQTGIVGYVTSSGRPRIALDVGDDAIFFNNPDLPKTRSEMALPLLIGEKVIGALDVQSEEAGAFSEEDISVLSLLADQISIAIQNSRLYAETRQALAETKALYSQSVTESWNLMARNLIRGYRYISGKVEPITRELDDVDIGQMLEIPVVSRGEIFGRVKIRLPEKLAESTSEDDLRLYELIAERLALALDNARLVEESQHRAAIERAISQMSGKIGAFTDIDAILQTTVQELGYLVNDSDIIIQLGKPNGK